VPPSERLAQRLALGVPALLLAGAYLSEYGFGLFPCEMCWWQRWPHFAAVALALASSIVPPRRVWIALAALAILVSGLIGGFHAGVEYDWWEGITGCAVHDGGGGDALEAVLNAPLIRCDQAPWSFLGLSLAGWNAVISTLAALAILVLLARSRRPARAEGGLRA
jgi:disulfide bond formation protein DsbB